MFIDDGNNVGTAELISHDEQGRIKLEESLRLALANSFQEHAGRAFTNLAYTAVRYRNYHLAMRVILMTELLTPRNTTWTH